jgi:RES domain-containing protein
MHCLAEEDLVTLRDDVFDIPKARPGGSLHDFLEAIFADYCEKIRAFKEPLACILESRIDRIKTLCDALVDAYRLGTAQDLSKAYSRMEAGLSGIHDELLAMSHRNSARVAPGQSWYRLAAWRATRHEQMFHMPFGRVQKSYRFSVAGVPGVPAIYLANSVYLCWLECGQPKDYDKCLVSRFEIDSSGFAFLDLPCSHRAYVDPLDDPKIPGFEWDPRRVTNSPYLVDVQKELAEYLTVWPLLATVSIRKLAEGPNPPEYVVPQLLMRWVAHQEKFLGVRYFTSKDDPSTNSNDWSINLALPARTTRDAGYCEFLAKRTRFTPPQRLSAMNGKTLESLVTKESGDRRQAEAGRYMLRWPDGRVEPYFQTVFGKMEYWLDRPEIQLARVQNV